MIVRLTIFFFRENKVLASLYTTLKGELQRENKLISYERAFKISGERYVYRWNWSSRSRVVKL